MSPRLGHLSEMSLYVDDLGAATTFYQRLFGFDILLEDDRMVGLQLPGSAVLLLHGRGGHAPKHEDAGAHHVCLPVSESSINDWERHLMLNGVAVEGRVTQANGSVSLYFRDLDGHSLELATPEPLEN
jgi:catechol-2,3-dioxygenase